jgi:hypothetical protein
LHQEARIIARLREKAKAFDGALDSPYSARSIAYGLASRSVIGDSWRIRFFPSVTPMNAFPVARSAAAVLPLRVVPTVVV